MLDFLRDTRYELENPIITYGNQYLPSKTTGSFVTLSTHGNVVADWFRPSTIVLGLNADNQKGESHAEWDLPIPEDVRKHLSKATFFVRAIRIQAGLHLHPEFAPYPENPRAIARILLNGKVVDELHLVESKIPFGTHYGFGREVSYPIENIIDEEDKSLKKWSIELEVGAGVTWDIDEIFVQVTTRRKRMKPGVWLCAGIVIGWFISRLFDWLATTLLTTAR